MNIENVKTAPKLLDGKKISMEIKKEIAQKINKAQENSGKIPHLAAILVGNDGASQTYVNHKVRACEQVGFRSTLIRREESISEEDLLKDIRRVNENPDIDGVIVQLPLPEHIDSHKVIACMDYKKDVDGFHPLNFGRMSLNLPTYIPATPLGILELLKRYEIETKGKHCVVVGRSRIVGAPMSFLMARKANATVTNCHRHTQNLSYFTKQADILITAVGKPGLVTENMVKEGVVIVDVGITRVKDSTKKSGFSLKGDIDFENVAPKCSYITPVPGGVGPMTIAGLLWNTLQSAQKAIYP